MAPESKKSSGKKDKELDSLRDYKADLLSRIELRCQTNQTFDDQEFYQEASEILAEARYLDNVSEDESFIDTRRGMRIDGWNWNPLEKTISGIIVKFGKNLDPTETITKTELEKLGKNVSRIFTQLDNQRFLESLAYEKRSLFDGMAIHIDDAIKYRVVVITDCVLSSRVKKIPIEKIRGKETSIEVWDLEKLKDLEHSSGESVPFTVNFKEMFGSGIDALPTYSENAKKTSYLCILPAKFLSDIYHEFGQRLLESNVRTFLEFRPKPNYEMRRTLVSEPENFFAFNNGLTVTATSHKTESVGKKLMITELENMQIVNGGQTTSVIYFAPREKGQITGEFEGEPRTWYFKDIDLDKVSVQMKLTVLGDAEEADELKSKISQYANLQSKVHGSDLVSNHPLHLNIEKLSRKNWMPPVDGIARKWFYERSRGQYNAMKRAARTDAAKRRFQEEYPKNQKFVKTDMAKFENTWRMKPFAVKQGAQKNLALLGKEMVREFETNSSKFGQSFYRDLIAKAILFKTTDSGILKSDWYQNERGYKAETVTYTISLLRHLLLKQDSDIDLKRIYENQKISDSLLEQIVLLANFLRNSIMDENFREGVANISEFCKSQKGWVKIRDLDFELKLIEKTDIVQGQEIADSEFEDIQLNKAGTQLEDLERVLGISQAEWTALKEFFKKEGYPESHPNVIIPKLCVSFHKNQKIPSEKQFKKALKIMDEGISKGFIFIRK